MYLWKRRIDGKVYTLRVPNRLHEKVLNGLLHFGPFGWAICPFCRYYSGCRKCPVRRDRNPFGVYCGHLWGRTFGGYPYNPEDREYIVRWLRRQKKI